MARSEPVWQRGNVLTPREQDVCELVLQGLTYKQIAQKLGISKSYVGARIQTIFNKCGFHSQEELRYCLNDGMLLRSANLVVGRRNPPCILTVFVPQRYRSELERVLS